MKITNTRNIAFAVLIFVTISMLGQGKPGSQNAPLLMYVGTETVGGTSQGIYLYEMDRNTGALKYLAVSPMTVNPTYIAIHPNNKWLYAVNEVNGENGKFGGEISAFRIDPAKKEFTFLNKVASNGNSPCHISIDNSGKFVLVANYSSGTVASYAIKADGSLSEAVSTDQHQGKGPNTSRQEGPHAHMIMQAQNGFVYNTDLGADQIYIYKLDAQGKLINTNITVKSKPGAGPRHLAFHTNNKWAYAVNELNGTVDVYTVNNKTGALTNLQTISTLPAGETRYPGSGDIHITPNGKFLYATNRGEINNIAMFSIDRQTGKLKLLGHQSTMGDRPRNFVMDPEGRFLLVANQISGNVFTFRIDPKTGILKDTGIETKIPSPMCLKFVY